MNKKKVKLLFCDVFKEELALLKLPPEEYDIEYLPMGLHYHPNKLRQEISAAMARVSGYSLVILGFGLCGGSLNGIKAPDSRVVMPRVHDCLPVLLGSREKYNELQKGDKRTFYFSGGWVEGERMLIQEYERSCIQFGPKKALKIFRMMFENYRRMMYIHTGHPRDASTLEKMREFAGIFNLPSFETTGNLEYLRKLVLGPWDEENFVIIPPFGLIDQNDFLAEGEELSVQGAQSILRGESDVC